MPDDLSQTPNPTVSQRWLTALILLLGLAARCAVIAWRSDQLTVDRDAYLGIAENLVAGNGFCLPNSVQPTAFRPPLYPLVLATVMIALPPAWAVAGINLLAGVATVWLVKRTGVALKLGMGSDFAAGLVAVDPLLLHATSQPMTEVLFTLLVTAWLWAMNRNNPRSTVAGGMIAGTCFGLAALCRPTIWPLALLVIVVGVFRCLQAVPADRPQRTSIAAILAASAVIAPWVVRNQLVLGQPIIMTTHGGYTLLLGNNLVFDEEVVRKPWGTTWPGDSLTRWQAEVEQRLQLTPGASTDELSRDAWMSSEAKKFIAARPDRFRAAIVHRIRSLWNVSPQGESASLPGWLRRAVAAFYIAEIVAAMMGIFVLIMRRQWFAWLPCLLLILTIQGVHLIYWTDARMRTPLEPVLALLAANGLSWFRKSKASSSP
ncbi:MAG: hypothetical protein U0872_02990 [Planctomycetaceae bacterium]